MKILYGIQGTGNGHISRARTFLPLLQEVAEVDVIISGTASEINLDIPVTYRYHGLGYSFGKRGGIEYWNTIKSLKPLQLLHDIKSLPVNKYDFIISDFEPVSSRAAFRAGKMCFGLSHQASFLTPGVPRPASQNFFGEQIFRHYAPCTHAIGLHYLSYNESVYTPVISSEIRRRHELSIRKNNPVSDPSEASGSIHRVQQSSVKNHSDRPHATVYLPAYDDRLLVRLFKPLVHIDWHIFSKAVPKAYRSENIYVHPVDPVSYVDSLIGCNWLICGAGFETPAEGLYLGKRILAIPMKGQYEQYCNAAALEQLGVTVVPMIDNTFTGYLAHWLDTARSNHIDYPNIAPDVISRILNLYDLNSRREQYPVAALA